MKLKGLIVAILVFLFVTAFLYFIGHTFKIEILTFHQKSIVTSERIYYEARSLLPLIIGIGAGYIAEKVYLTRKYSFSQKN